MTNQQTRTTSKQADQATRQPKPKPVAATPAVESAALQRALDDPLNASPQAMLAVQKSTGNRAASHLIQTKLTVGAAGDQYEQEADRVAEQVVTMPAPVSQQPAVQRAPEEEEELQMKPLAASITPLVQRAVAEEEEVQRVPEEEDELQMKPLVQRAEIEEEEELQAKPEVQRSSGGAGFEVSGDFEQQLAASRGGGSPLPDIVRDFMEPRFGADFSNVRVHAGSESAQLNRAVSAQAFTLGQDIYLGEGKTDLESSAGKSLLAHELTHVVQQTGSTVRPKTDTLSRSVAGLLQRTFADSDLPSLDKAIQTDLTTNMSAQELEDYATAVGATRLKELVTVRKLTAAALKFYTAVFLKDFIGAGDETIRHISTFDGAQKNQIKGCHDEDLFRAKIIEDVEDTIKVPDPGNPKKKIEQKVKHPLGRIESESDLKPLVKNLVYKLMKRDGSGDWRNDDAKKTVIKGLIKDKAKWQAYANEAIWNAIAAQTFPKATGKFSGHASDGGQVDGYYNGGAEVDTFFIIS